MTWLTSKEAAEYLRCSVKAIQSRTTNGTIPHRKFGRACLFDEAELRAYLDGCALERITTVSGGRIVRPKP